ncbi:hypothetical protein YC2023_118345 [Brassica napus]
MTCEYTHVLIVNNQALKKSYHVANTCDAAFKDVEKQKWSRLVTCCHVSVLYPWRCRNVDSPVTETRTLVASLYWAFFLMLITTRPQALVFK